MAGFLRVVNCYFKNFENNSKKKSPLSKGIFDRCFAAALFFFLFVAQGVDGIGFCGFGRRVKSEENAHHGRKAHRQ